MNVVYGKTLSNDDISVIKDISERCGILFDTARLMFYRGITDTVSAKKFLSSGESGLYNPFLLNGISETVERIKTAKEKNENVLVFGDYDADGISAATTLYFCLKEYGISARVTVPERSDGYGLNIEKIKAVHDEFKLGLIITVDCGISDNLKVEEIKSLGIDIIVTDHHEPPEVLPDCITVNPKIKGQNYPFDGLCGAGVAYKLGYALIGEKANKYLDLTALATVADSMDLIDENRCIVSLGLKLLNSKNIRPSFKYILGDNQREITSQTLAFIIAPRVNAGGRMGDANCALRLFISDDENEIYDLAVKLNSYNIGRQVGCDEIYKRAKTIIKENNLCEKEVILVADDGWSTGFIGIVASRLVEDYNRPVIVFAQNEGTLKGSARSVEGINIFDAINGASEYLEGFGGHSQAAGVTIKSENFAIFGEKLCEFIRNKYGAEYQDKKIYADWEIKKSISFAFSKEIEMLEPFGVGNRKPTFTTTVKATTSLPLKNGSPHYSFDSEFISMLDFNGECDVFPLSLPVEKKIVFELNCSVFRGKESLKGIVKNIVVDYNNAEDLSLFVFDNELRKLKTKDDKKIDFIKEKVDIECGFGRMFVLSNGNNLDKYDYPKNMGVYYFNPPEKNPLNCIVISPKYIPDCFNSVVYLDTPSALINGDAKTIGVNNNLPTVFGGLSCDREVFAKAFNIIKNYQEKVGDFVGILCDNGEMETKQLLFCAEVFSELGIFYFENGKLKRNEKIKKPLNGSTIYNEVLSLEKLC